MNSNTKKGLIIGGSVLGVVLILTGIGLGIYFGTKGSGDLTTVAFTDAVSGTAIRQDAWMGIDDYDGGEYVKGDYDATLIKNKNYQSVDKEDKILDIVSSEDGLSYLSRGYLNYGNYIEKDDLNVLGVIEDGKAINGEDEGYPLVAPLNMNMRVPSKVANYIKDSFIGGEDAGKEITIDGLNTAFDGYGTWLKDDKNKGYMFDFAISIIIFNYTASTESAANGLESDGFKSWNETTISDEEFVSWIKSTFSNQEWGIVNSEGDIDFHGFENDGTYEVKIGGTGTNSPAVASIMKSFSQFNFGTEDEPFKFSVMEKLSNHGSGGAWYQSKTKPGFDKEGSDDGYTYMAPGEYDGQSNDVPENYFLGTQSRAFNEKTNDGDQSSDSWINWGYDATTYTSSLLTDNNKNEISEIDGENSFYIYEDTLGTEDFPIVTTMAADSVVFFTTNDAEFELDGKTYHPTALSSEGAKEIFQNGANWIDVAEMGLIQYEE